MLNHEGNLADGWVSFASIGSVDKALQKMRALLEHCATEPHGAQDLGKSRQKFYPALS